jgi:hypothetical protein
MMKAVRDTIEGDAKGFASGMFPKDSVISVVTAPTEEKFKDIHPRKMTITLDNDLKVDLTVTGKVNRKDTGGLPYTVEVVKVSNLQCVRKGKAVLPEGAEQALKDAKDLTGEEAKKAAQAAYPGEKLESVTVSDLAGPHDRRAATAAVSMSNGVKVDLSTVGGYRYDPKAHRIEPEFVGFDKATCTRNGQPDTPATPIKLMGKE